MFGYYAKLSLRSLRRNWVLSALMVMAIALGIGTSMTTLTVMRLLSGDPMPGRSDTLFYAQVDARPDSATRREPLDMIDYRSAVDLWSAKRADRQTMVARSPVKLQAPGTRQSPSMGTMLSTTSDFFTMFDVPFRYGGPWRAEDGEKRARVAVISADLNRKLFGGVDSVGRELQIRGTSVRIVGVLDDWRPRPLFYTVAGGNFAQGDTGDFYGKPQDVLVPFFTSLELNDGHFQQFTCWDLPETPGSLQNTPCVWIGLWAQLDDEEAVAGYRRFLNDYAAQQKAMGRFASTNNVRLRNLMQWLDYNHVVPADVRVQTWLAFSFLAICLFNTVGLLLAKFLRRSGEIGVRRALGASRSAVFAQCLVEAGMIGLAGGFAGWLLTLAGLWLVRRQPAAYADLAHLDLPMFLVTFALAVAVSLLAGMLPALRASRVAPGLQIKTLGGV
ncbi:ABC transporter permease [Luteimonas soli]|uniref:ABC transporter permease n=1 Tax=Luteimonas soli TaxID=1648966 RepID=A0ABV7XET0_9GAMM